MIINNGKLEREFELGADVGQVVILEDLSGRDGKKVKSQKLSKCCIDKRTNWHLSSIL